MASTERHAPTAVSPSALEDEFESLRREFHVRLQGERVQLTMLAASLTRIEGDASAIFERLRLFAHRMHGAASIFQSTQVAIAAGNLERASTFAAASHADRSDSSVWTAVVALVDLLAVMNGQRPSVSTDFY